MKSVLDSPGVWDFDNLSPNAVPMDYFNLLTRGDTINNIVTATNKSIYGVLNSSGFTIRELYKYIGTS